MIKLIDDIAGPIGVGILDMVLVAKKPTWNRSAAIASAAVGLIGGGVMRFGKGGNFLKQWGVASVPWAMQSIYAMVKDAPDRVTKGSRERERIKAQTSGRGVGLSTAEI